MLRTEFDRSQPRRVVIYARMSTDRQNARSPDQQIATVKEVIRRQGLPWTVVATYRDDAKSGRYKYKRPQFVKMLSDLKSGRLDVSLLLVDTFERLSRADDGADLRRQLQRAGVLVLTGDSGFADPTTSSGMALTFVESIRATEDGRIKAHNVLRGKKDALRQRHWPGGPVPFGYRLRNVMTTKNGVEEIDHRVLEPDPKTRWIIAEVFRLAYEKGWGTNRIAKSLQKDARIPKELKPFFSSTIGAWLDNEIYCGTLVWGKNCTGIVDDARVLQPLPKSEWERIPDFCEPIVAQDFWDRVQQLRRQRGQNSRRSRKAKRRQSDSPTGPSAHGIALKYMLTGLVRCAHCRRAMTPSSSQHYTTKSGEERHYLYYVCPGFADGLCDNGRSIPEKWLREKVVELVRQRLFFEEA